MSGFEPAAAGFGPHFGSASPVFEPETHFAGILLILFKFPWTFFCFTIPPGMLVPVKATCHRPGSWRVEACPSVTQASGNVRLQACVIPSPVRPRHRVEPPIIAFYGASAAAL